MNNTEYKELIENLNNIEAIAYGYNINGEVLGMDCSDFEQIMVDSAVAITELMDILAKVTAERDAAVEWLADLEVCGCCKNTQCRSRDGEEDCKFEWIGVQEAQEDE